MAKAQSPVRLESRLMKAAKLAGITHHRSAAEQVEYWAELGRRVSGVLDPEDLLAVSAGIAKVTLVPSNPVEIDSDALFASLDRQRERGALSEAIQSDAIRYQASSLHPGLLEQVHPDGRIVLGSFQDGVFNAQQVG